jgi:hypothetical protein
VGGDAMRDAQAGVPSTGWLRAQLAFKNSMVHGILQFTPSIAFCYVLHRCVSRDIRCRESFVIKSRPRQACTPQTGQDKTSPSQFMFSLAHSVPGFVSPTSTHGAPKETPHLHARVVLRIKTMVHLPITSCDYKFTGRSALQGSTMILPQVHLRKPCYDFSFL